MSMRCRRTLAFAWLAAQETASPYTPPRDTALGRRGQVLT